MRVTHNDEIVGSTPTGPNMKIDITTIEGMIAQALIDEVGKPTHCAAISDILWFIQGEGPISCDGIKLKWGEIDVNITEVGIAILEPEYYVYDFAPINRRSPRNDAQYCLRPDWSNPNFNPALAIKSIAIRIKQCLTTTTP